MGPSGGALVGSWGFLVRSQVLLGSLLGGLGGLLGSSMGDSGVLLGPHGSLHCGCLQVRSKKKDFMKMCSWLEREQDFQGSQKSTSHFGGAARGANLGGSGPPKSF